MVKQLRKWLKIGVHSGFGPRFPVEFEAFFKKIWTGLIVMHNANRVEVLLTTTLALDNLV